MWDLLVANDTTYAFSCFCVDPIVLAATKSPDSGITTKRHSLLNFNIFPLLYQMKKMEEVSLKWLINMEKNMLKIRYSLQKLLVLVCFGMKRQKTGESPFIHCNTVSGLRLRSSITRCKHYDDTDLMCRLLLLQHNARDDTQPISVWPGRLMCT